MIKNFFYGLIFITLSIKSNFTSDKSSIGLLAIFDIVLRDITLNHEQ